MAVPGAGSARAGERLGLAVLGGSFNPPHATHARICASAVQHLPIDEVRVVPTGDHPHKQGRDMARAKDRLAMCRLAFAGLAHVVVDDREVRRRGPSFTVDTLEELHREAPARALYFLIGSDNLPLLPTWRHHHRILQLCTVVTYPRHGYPVAPPVLDGLDLSATERRALLDRVLPLPADDRAASDVRERWRAGERALAELSPEVERYIATHRLYPP
jgi:nicotinate-nucleotide adenylyltransferase